MADINGVHDTIGLPAMHAPGQAEAYVTIGEAAKDSGISAKMIRYYESIGLISRAVRSGAGYRYYSQEDIRVLRFIRRARALGFSSDDIARLIRVWRWHGAPSSEVKTLAVNHVAELRERIAALEEACTLIEELVARCPGDAEHECPILAELDDRVPPPNSTPEACDHRNTLRKIQFDRFFH